MRNYELEVKISEDNVALEKNEKKCITCGYCKNVCCDDVTVARMFELDPNREPICIQCGQCANMCPTEAIHEKMDYLKVKELLHNRIGKKIAISIAPAVRVALGEEFQCKVGSNLEGKIATALRSLGADYVFDIVFGADLTIMEEAMELVNRIQNHGILPQFTSCCPAWVKYCEIFFPEYLPHLSTAKSPIAMQSTLIKTYFAEKIGVSSDDIIHIVVAPCTAKKAEIRRMELNYTGKDADYVLTTRELALLLKEESIELPLLKESKFDSPLGTGSGAGVIFGASGGVCEAALRSAYYFMTGEDLPNESIQFTSVRGMDGIKVAKVEILNQTIQVCVCNGMKNAYELLKKLSKGEVYYDFIEVMNCIGGCIAGGGQPKITLLNTSGTKIARSDGLYEEDEKMTLRYCHHNPEIVSIYQEYLGRPNSEMAERLLHTHYEDKSYLLGGNQA